VLINLFSEALDRAGRDGRVALAASADGNLVQIEVSVPGTRSDPRGRGASLAVCLARALLELQGAALIEVDDPSCTWRAVTVLECAVQADFFALGHAGAPATTSHGLRSSPCSLH
jgi:hypothetical protein